MKKLGFTLVAVLAVLFCQSQEEISIEDYKFTMSAAKVGLMELKLGQLALSNGSSPDIKMLAERMVTHHTKANMELKKLADQRGIFLVAGLNDKQQKRYRKLSMKTGSDFDKAYAKYIAMDHKKVINAFEKEIKKGQDIELKSWALVTRQNLESQLHNSDVTNETIVKEKLEKLITFKN